METPRNMKRQFEANVDELFQKYPGDEDIRFFVERIHANSIYAEKVSNRRLFLIFFYWFISWAIGSELVSEGTLNSFKLNNIKSLLIIAPPLLGILYYLLTTSRVSLSKLDTIIKCYYRNKFPEYKHQNLFRFVLAPDYSNIEDYVLFTSQGKIVRFSAIVAMFAFYFLILILPLVAFVQSSYLLWISKNWHWATSASSILIGILFWFRSMIFWLQIFKK